MSGNEAIVSVQPTDNKLPGRRARRLAGLRANSAAICVMLLAEYGLGMGVNLYLPVPPADQHHGLATAIGRALTSQPAALAVHAGLGLLMLVAGVSVLTRAILARHRPAIGASATGLTAIAAAAVSGASYANAGHTAASMAMAILTGVALLCYLLILFVTGSSAARSQGRADDQTHHRDPDRSGGRS